MDELERRAELDRDSGMRLDFTLSIGYTRRRPGLGVEDKWEAHVGTAGLLIIGGVIALLLVWLIVPRVLDAFGH